MVSSISDHASNIGDRRPMEIVSSNSAKRSAASCRGTRSVCPICCCVIVLAVVSERVRYIIYVKYTTCNVVITLLNEDRHVKPVIQEIALHKRPIFVMIIISRKVSTTNRSRTAQIAMHSAVVAAFRKGVDGPGRAEPLGRLYSVSSQNVCKSKGSRQDESVAIFLPRQ